METVVSREPSALEVHVGYSSAGVPKKSQIFWATYVLETDTRNECLSPAYVLVSHWTSQTGCRIRPLQFTFGYLGLPWFTISPEGIITQAHSFSTSMWLNRLLWCFYVRSPQIVTQLVTVMLNFYEASVTSGYHFTRGYYHSFPLIFNFNRSSTGGTKFYTGPVLCK